MVNQCDQRRILLLVTNGGWSHATPMFEIGSILASRGHEIHFATNSSQLAWVSDLAFIVRVHDLGPPLPENLTASQYEKLSVWKPRDGMRPLIACKQVFESHWTSTFGHLQRLCRDPCHRPDFIVADFFCEDAARDMLYQHGIQVATIWPQLPYGMAPASYIPGHPGLQSSASLTSEHASLLSRFQSELPIIYALPSLWSWTTRTRSMRSRAGVNYSLSYSYEPDHLVLVNSFFGLEIPKDLPPLVAAVGPILSEQYPSLGSDLCKWMESRSQIVYVSFGTHALLSPSMLEKLLRGLLKSLDEELIDGVVWFLPSTMRKSLLNLPGHYSPYSPSDIIENRCPHIHLSDFAPQRAILNHPSTKLFITHAGGSSTNETVFHGVPVIAVGIYFDQISNSARLEYAGVGISLDKSTLTTDDISNGIRDILADEDGLYQQNVYRMQRIARIASRRKYLAADLIEEVMIDQELRFHQPQDDGSPDPHLFDGSVQQPLRPMHLQTAGARMSTWRAKNWDMWLVSLVSIGTGGFVGWWMLRRSWKLAFFNWPASQPMQF